MCVPRGVFFFVLLTGAHCTLGHKAEIQETHYRKIRAVNDGDLRFDPVPYNKKLELNSSGKIHCKVSGGVAPSIQWFLNDNSPLPEGVTSVNGTLFVSAAARTHKGRYTCRVIDGERKIETSISLDVVVTPRVLEPVQDQIVHGRAGQPMQVSCITTGDPAPTLHWDRNRTALHTYEGVEVEGSANASSARMLVLNNGTLVIRSAAVEDSGRYGCTAGSSAGFGRSEFQILVHPEGEPIPTPESTGVAGKAVIVSVSVAGAYMVLVLALMFYCRRRRLQRRQRGEKLELEMAEGREKLVEEGEEDKKVGNGTQANGRLLAHERDSGSEMSAVSRGSKKSGRYDHLAVPRTLLTEQITIGRGEFGDISLAKIDMSAVSKLRNKSSAESEIKVRPVLVKALTTKDETQLAEFRRHLDMFGRLRHANIVRLIGLCNETSPHLMLLQHTDWGDLKSFLASTRTAEEWSEYRSRVGSSLPERDTERSLPPLSAAHRALLASHLASAAACLASHALTHSGRRSEYRSRVGSSLPERDTERYLPPLSAAHRALLATHLASAAACLASHALTHRDIAARNCVITSSLVLKLSHVAVTRGPHAHEYYKLHDQVIPLRWLPSEAVLESDYSTKSDVYMFAATVWEIYTKAELPFAKLNDNSVMERLKAGTLEWSVPDSMPDRLAALLRRCWSASPADRPHFTEVSEETTAILQEVTAENTEQSQGQEL